MFGAYQQPNYYVTLVISFILFSISSCNCSANNSELDVDPLGITDDSINIDLSVYKINDVFSINDTLDLQKKTLYLPENITLVINKGVIRNGCVVGNNTYLKYKDVAFDRVHIKGTWIVPYIYTSMFRDLSYDNSLKDVFALSNPQVKNTIFIAKGKYKVTANQSNPTCLEVCSNTDVRLNGDILMISNALSQYSIIKTVGDNIILKGSGSVIGDKQTHKDQKGEWGMGIYIRNGDNIKVKGLTVKDCWGDCIYIAKNSGKIIIDGCYLDNGRRQGISVISASYVTIKNCTITNVGGVAPQYAIDVEPNEGDQVGYVKIRNVKVKNCIGGFACYGKAKGAHINTISIKKCSLDNTSSCPFYFVVCDTISVEKCSIDKQESIQSFWCKNVGSVRLNKNRINHPLALDKNNNNDVLEKAIVIENANKKIINNNIITTIIK